jgi:protein-disulfide isomerase
MSRLTPPVGPHDHVQGPPNAPLTLVEYGDYECGYCGEAYLVVKEVQLALGDNLRFVFRNFPLGEAHPHAEHAAELAEAAAGAGQFWPMHDLLYERQSALDDESLVAYGVALELPEEALRSALGGFYAKRVREDFISGVRSGVNGTPTFFINGRRHDGTWNLDGLMDALREAADQDDR